MQQLQRRRLFSLMGIVITMAALTAPPSVFAETAPTPPGGTTPAPATPVLPAPPAGAVKIGLGRSLTAADVVAPGGLYVVGDGAFQLQTAPGAPVHVALDAGQIAVTGVTTIKFTSVRLVPVPPPAAPTAPAPAVPPPVPANPISYNKKSYRGEVSIVITKTGKLSLINVVNLDEYLLGVVPKEVDPDWPAEALKAQAVAARTYSLSHIGRWVEEGFDMVDTTLDQAYGAIASERPQTAQAVYATQGQVLTYGAPPSTKLISAMYSASSGGHTENNEIINASLNGSVAPVSYLRGVDDYDNVQGNTRYAWNIPFTVDDFVQRLKSVPCDVGNITGVAPVGQPGVSGRYPFWQLTGTLGTKTITGTQMRTALGVWSNPKSVTLQAGGLTSASKSFAETGTFFVMGANGVMNRTAKGTSVLSAPKAFSVVAGAVTAMGAKVDQPVGVIVAGGGYGHALGMSQWGAYGMAVQGKTYMEILTHYYTGTQLETRQTTP